MLAEDQLSPELLTDPLAIHRPAGIVIRKATFDGRHEVRGGLRFRYLGDRPAFDEASPEYRYFTSKTLANGQPNQDYDPTRVMAQGYLIFDAYVSYRYEIASPSLSL